MLADPKTGMSVNVEAYFLLKLSNLSKAQRSQVLASIGNSYDPKTMGEAMRVQFADLHKSEGRYQRDCGAGQNHKGRGLYAFAAEEYDEADEYLDTAGEGDYEYDEGGMTDLEE